MKSGKKNLSNVCNACDRGATSRCCYYPGCVCGKMSLVEVIRLFVCVCTVSIPYMGMFSVSASVYVWCASDDIGDEQERRQAREYA